MVWIGFVGMSKSLIKQMHKTNNSLKTGCFKTLVFHWFYNVSDAKCCISLGFLRFLMESVGFPQVLITF